MDDFLRYLEHKNMPELGYELILKDGQYYWKFPSSKIPKYDRIEHYFGIELIRAR